MQAASQFTGTIAQIPPSYSAVHVNGKRAHQLARAGESFEIPSRRVTVHSFELSPMRDNLYVADLTCSAGTYIRSIAQDLGRAVGSAAHVSELRRTSVGPFSVDDAVTPAKFLPERDLRSVISSLSALHGIEIGEVPPYLVHGISHGQKISAADIPGLSPTKDRALLLTHENRALAVAKVSESGKLDYSVVFSADGSPR